MDATMSLRHAAAGGDPPAYSPLQVQLPALRAELHRASGLLERLAEIDAALHARVAARFAKAAKKAEAELDLVDAAVAAGGLDADLWPAFVKARERCTELGHESLAFVEGALVRRARLDGGLCAIADEMLDDLSERLRVPWKRITILAENDFYGELAQIVRLRYPELTAWTLPIAAHEFGHFVAARIAAESDDGGPTTISLPLQELLSREHAREQEGDRSAVGWNGMHEHIADLFATYTAGPAYVYACVALRFDPAHGPYAGRRHPLPSARVDLMLRALRALDRDGVGSYGGIVDDLSARWRAARVATGRPPEIADETAEQVAAVFDELYPIFDERVEDARYSSFVRAQQLAPALVRRERPDERPAIRDVLNASWVARMRAGEADAELLDRIAATATEWCTWAT